MLPNWLDSVTKIFGVDGIFVCPFLLKPSSSPLFPSSTIRVIDPGTQIPNRTAQSATTRLLNLLAGQWSCRFVQPLVHLYNAMIQPKLGHIGYEPMVPYKLVGKKHINLGKKSLAFSSPLHTHLTLLHSYPFGGQLGALGSLPFSLFHMESNFTNFSFCCISNL